MCFFVFHENNLNIFEEEKTSSLNKYVTDKKDYGDSTKTKN